MYRLGSASAGEGSTDTPGSVGRAVQTATIRHLSPEIPYSDSVFGIFPELGHRISQEKTRDNERYGPQQRTLRCKLNAPVDEKSSHRLPSLAIATGINPNATGINPDATGINPNTVHLKAKRACQSTFLVHRPVSSGTEFGSGRGGTGSFAAGPRVPPGTDPMSQHAQTAGLA